MKILVTGFDPFGDEDVNPSLEIVNKLPEYIGGCEVIKLKIPTVFGKSAKNLINAIETEKPDVVICLGQAGGEGCIRVERVAINLNDARIADNDGKQPLDEFISDGGASAYFSNLPVKRIVSMLKVNEIPARVSYSAGTFVCNHVFYSLMEHINSVQEKIIGGFIHIPMLPKQVIDKPNGAHMSLEMMVQAIIISIKACINEEKIEGSQEVLGILW